MSFSKVLFFTVIAMIRAGYAPLAAQSFTYRHFSVEDGLSSSTVYCSIQDRKGFMWFGTESGVNRFDGRTFEQFTMDDGLSDNEVFKIFEDSQGRLWFLTFNGHLSYYLDGKFYNEKNDKLLREAFARSPFVDCFSDKEGTIYLTSQRFTLSIIHPDRVKKIFIPSSSRHGSFQLFSNTQGQVFLYTGSNLFRIVHDSLEPIKTFPITHPRFTNLQTYSKDASIYALPDGIWRLTEHSNEVILDSPELKNNIESGIISVREDRNKNLWVGMWNKGVLLYSPDTSGKYRLVNHLMNDRSVHSVYIDNENNTWFTTEGNGIYLLQSKRHNAVAYTRQDGLLSEQVYVIKKGRDNVLLLGCGNSILTKIYRDSIENIPLIAEESPAKVRVYDIMMDDSSGIFCGTGQNIFYLQQNKKPRVIPSTDNTGKIWFGSSLKMFGKEKDGTVTGNFSVSVQWLRKFRTPPYLRFISQFNSDDYSIRTYSHFFDHDNRLWVSTINGLCLWQDKKLVSFAEKEEVLKNRFMHISEMSDSTLVLSSDGSGIIFFKNNHVVNHLTKSKGIASNICRRICIRQDTVWIATNLGLTTFVYSHNQVSGIHTLTTDDGLLSNDVKDVLVDGNTVYVATDKGLCLLENSTVQNKADPPVLYITHILCAGKEWNDFKNISIDYNKNPVKINFITPTFQSPEKVLYEYSLGDDKSRVETKNNFVEFSNLPPGNYTIELRAKKFNSPWSLPLKVELKVVPPYWKTWWFRTIMIILNVTGIYLVLRLYYIRKFEKEKILLEQHRLLTNERLRISSDIHDDLGSGLSQIAILSEVVKKDKDLPANTSRQLDKISASSHELIDKMGEIIWALNTSNDSMKNLLAYIHEYVLDFAETHKLKASVSFPQPVADETISAIVRRNIFLVIKEALNNLLKHAGADSFSITAVTEKGLLKITIADNGKGFKTESPVTGQGINNMKKRIREINGEIKITSYPGVKTEIDISIPLHTG